MLSETPIYDGLRARADERQCSRWAAPAAAGTPAWPVPSRITGPYERSEGRHSRR
ncbi:MAG: hypothetical protein ACRDRN_03980 [Sciscionella sp.]